MRAEEIKGLMEAYAKVHETPEVLSEEVEDLHEIGVNFGGQAAVDKARAEYKASQKPVMTAYKAGGGDAKMRSLMKQGLSGVEANRRVSTTGEYLQKQSAKPAPTLKGLSVGKSGFEINGKPMSTGSSGSGRSGLKGGVTAAPARPAASGSGLKGGVTAAPARPAASSPTKPAATAAPKPTATPTPAKPAGSAMDQWAKANPKLAAAKAERDRTRGTSATTNPLMKDMKSSMPAPKSPAPSTAKTGFDLAKKGVNLAAGIDIFDLVKGHLLDEGYAETEENALVMMANMSEEWRESIVQEVLGEGRKEFPHKKVDRKVYDAMDSGETAGDSGDSDKEERDYNRAEKMRSVAAKHGGKSRVKEEVDINEKMEKWIQKVIDEGRYTSLQALSRESQQRKEDEKRGRPETESERHGRLMLGKFRPGASKEERAEGGRQRLKDRGKVPKKGGKDMFEEVLEYLVAEGYADTNEAAISIIANMGEEWMVSIFEEIEQLDEISQKTATRAYARGTSDEFEGQDDPKQVNRNMRLRDRIEKKFGKKAAQHADRAAHAETFGRKGAGGMPPKPKKGE